MKKIILASLVASLVMVMSLSSYGQVATTTPQFVNHASSPENSISKDVSNKLGRSDVNSKAVRNFVKAFKDVSDEKWYKAEDGFISKFYLNDTRYQVAYGKKGNWLFTIRTYDEDKLPKPLRHIVKSSYYDYAILVVQEIEQPRDNLTYIVHLVGKTEIINLRLTGDGEMDEYEKIKKLN